MNENYRQCLENVLKSVSKPGRYCGGEYGSVIKDKEKVKARWAFCFPDSYEIGMSNLGIRILYGVLNREDDIWCERAYAPWPDMEEMMKKYDIPLTAAESCDPLSEFDIIGFTLQYEMCYTNVLNMLRLSGLPLRSADRGDDMPIVIGGGPCSYNAEPIADFFDCFSIGEGEDMLVEFTKLYIKMKEDGTYTKKAFLHEAARTIKGTYVPSLYDVSYNDDGTVKAYTPIYDDIPTRITKRIMTDMDKAFFPEKVVMPYIETVQDRIMLEVYRGCIRGCRFCQAGVVYRPVREKTAEVLCRQAKCLYESTGYDEISLSSLSISDYTEIEKLTTMLLEWTDKKKINLSLPSLRADSFTKELMDKVSSVRSSSLTFAPEAGTQRLRDVINKNVFEKDIFRAVNVAYDAGKSQVKLYFMNGLPTETDEDLAGIAKLASDVVSEYYKSPVKRSGRSPQVTISVACFVPKPFTPFQWEAQDTLEEFERKNKYIGECVNDRKVRYTHHDPRTSRIEGVLARGDRRLGRALEIACDEGFHFDAWEEYFDYDRWISVIEKAGLDPSFYANRRRSEDEVLPWDIIDCGVTKEFFSRERKHAYEGVTTPNCREKCSACGANKLGGERSCCPKKK